MRRLIGLFCLILIVGCGPEILVADEFDQNFEDRWLLEEDSFGRTTITDGRLFLQVNEPNTIQYSTLRQPLFKNFDLEVDVTLVSGSTNSSYGILFRMQEGGAFYRFDITGNGQYMVEKRLRDGSFQRLNAEGRWAQTPVLKTGVGEVNRIKVSAVETKIVISANGELIEEINNFDGAYGVGNIAFDAGTFASPSLQVAFDNLLISEP